MFKHLRPSTVREFKSAENIEEGENETNLVSVNSAKSVNSATSINSTAQRAFAKIASGKAAAKTLRVRVSGLLLAVFTGISGISQILGYLCKWQVLSGSAHVFWSFSPTGYGMLLAVLPSDVLIIRCLTAVGSVQFVVSAIERAIYAWWVLHGHCPPMYQDVPVACDTAAAMSALQGGAFLLGAAGISTTLRTKNMCFIVPARRALDRLWNAIRLTLICIGLCEATEWIISCVVLPKPMAWLYILGPVLMSASFIFTSAFVTRGNRSWALNWLGSLVVADEVKAASVVASLTSNLQSPLLRKRAVSQFRAIRFSSLCEADFSTNRCERDLGTLSVRSKMGQVDVFLSHSWHDPADTKWAALSQWARTFRDAHGDDPTIWLDKACIDQQNIEQSLSCPPIYLAACKKLLVLAGPTYSYRLWCIMEIFTFLQMGGDWNNIEIYPIAAENHDDAEQARREFVRQFDDFDALRARCFKDSDREHFLGIIEGAFGSTVSFNVAVQKLFTRRMSVLPVLRQDQEPVGLLGALRSSKGSMLSSSCQQDQEPVGLLGALRISKGSMPSSS